MFRMKAWASLGCAACGPGLSSKLLKMLFNVLKLGTCLKVNALAQARSRSACLSSEGSFKMAIQVRKPCWGMAYDDKMLRMTSLVAGPNCEAQRMKRASSHFRYSW